ncbi:MAG: ATP-binding protein [Nanoarchaeota archaeon]|nr:ATP-binding protein [Nanoarchaeota archaeon]
MICEKLEFTPPSFRDDKYLDSAFDYICSMLERIRSEYCIQGGSPGIFYLLEVTYWQLDVNIREIFKNSLDALIDKCDSNGKIAIAVGADEEHIEAVIEDNGLGYSQSALSLLPLHKRYPSAKSREIHHGKSGLGMSTTAIWAKGLGGELRYWNSLSGAVTTFNFPFKDIPAIPFAHTDISVMRKHIVEWKTDEVISKLNDYAQSERPYFLARLNEKDLLPCRDYCRHLDYLLTNAKKK